MKFVGSKGGAGVAEWLITAMPAHLVYVEAFAGKAVVGEKKRPAYKTHYIEKNPQTALELSENMIVPDVSLHVRDCLPLIRDWLLAGVVDREWLFYFDPPYLMETRSSKRKYYAHEFSSLADHEQLLNVALELPCKVMISGYRSELYAQRLASWRMETFWTDPKSEPLSCNSGYCE